MTVRPSKNIESLPGYAFAEVGKIVADLRAQDVHVLDFGVGDPSAPTPKVIRERGQAAIDEFASSGYPSYIGSVEFRTAVAAWVERRYAVLVDPAKHVSATIGSKESIFHMPLAFVDPGDVVISPNPGYPPFTRGTTFAGGENWTYPVLADNDFLPDLGAIPDHVLDRTKMLWINYPNSPTGKVAPLEFFEEAAKFCRLRDILLVSDEAYGDLWYGDVVPPSALQTGLENVISVFSLSKRSNMTGWRSGFVVGDADAVGYFRKLKTNIDSGTPDFVRAASITALEERTHVAAARADYLEKRNLLSLAFTGIGLPNCAPEGTMFMWQRIPEGMTSVDFAKKLLHPEIAVVVTPGTWLSSIQPNGIDPGEGYVRLAMVPDVSACREAAIRISKLEL